MPFLHKGYAGLGPLQWAILFDKTDFIKIYLDALVMESWKVFIEMLNFASIFAQPDTMLFILDYCQTRYAPYYLDWYEQELFKDPHLWSRSRNPLQLAFDYGKEENFQILTQYGMTLDYIEYKKTKANEKSEFFANLISSHNVKNSNHNEL